MKNADALVLLAKEETVLQGMVDRLIEIGRCYRKILQNDVISLRKSAKCITPWSS
jgi:hypothetical protein